MNTPPRTNRAAGTPLPAGTLPSDDDTDMTRTYVQVVILEAAVIAALWLLGRAFS